MSSPSPLTSAERPQPTEQPEPAPVPQKPSPESPMEAPAEAAANTFEAPRPEQHTMDELVSKPAAPPEPASPAVTEAERENAFQKARSDGFERGYRDGEEKAMIAVQEKVAAITDELANVLGELEGLKGNILASTQENFRLVAEGLLGSLLQKEVAINPESFAKLIEKAIAEAGTER